MSLYSFPIILEPNPWSQDHSNYYLGYMATLWEKGTM
jgi:hypothetical protein